MDSKPKNFKEALDQLEDQTDRGGSNFRQYLEDEIKKLEGAIDRLKPHVEDAKAKVTKEVEANPWAALGIVAFVSFLIGFLLAPRSRRDD